MDLGKRRLGKTGERVTLLGLGGEGVLRTYDREKEAVKVIQKALDLGITYFDSAKAYSDSEHYYGLALGERREDIFLTSKSHARDKLGCLKHLEDTLERMKTDHLDLWQVHDVRTMEDVHMIFRPGGAIEAFQEAKEKGLVRFIGVTGHRDPMILKECLNRFPFDTLLMPLNPAEPHFRDFIKELLPIAVNKGIGIIGMKAYLKGFPKRLPGFKGFEPYLRYGLSHPISTAIIGCDTPAQVEENVEYALRFKEMTDDEKQEMVEMHFKYARALMYYKTGDQ